MARQVCIVDDCAKVRFGHGYCHMHYMRVRRTGTVGPAHRTKGPGSPKKLCQVEGCVGRYEARGYCHRHAYRFRRYGDPGPVEMLRLPNGAGHVDGQGYRFLPGETSKKGPREHRAVMEAVLGRKLHPFENVHHKNGRKADNRPANLELWITPQPSGQRPEDIADWMSEYYPEVQRASLAKRDARVAL